MRALALAAAALFATPVARADDFTMDMRMPARVGFDYSGMTRGPALAFGTSVEVDVLRVAPRVALTLAVDVDSATRLDLPEDDPRASLGSVGAGLGIFWVTPGRVGFGVESAPCVVFDDAAVVGGGFEARATLVPFYVPLDEAMKTTRDRFGAWVRSAFSFWVQGRVDWTSDGNGGSLAFGAAVDLARIFVLPYAFAIQKVLR